MNKKQQGKTLRSEAPQKERYTLRLDNESRIDLSKRQKQQQSSRKNHTWFYLGLVGDIGLAIVLPIAGGAILGAYIDRQWSIYPKATLTFLFVGMIISIAGFIHTLRDIIKKN